MSPSNASAISAFLARGGQIVRVQAASRVTTEDVLDYLKSCGVAVRHSGRVYLCEGKRVRLIPEAYKEAGFRGGVSNSYRMKDKVKARIAYLKREFVDKLAEKVAGGTAAVILAERVKDSVDRQYVIDGLKRVVEISLGDRKVPKLRMVATKTTTKSGKVTIKQEQVEIQDFDINLPAATRALELLGRAVGEPFDGSGDTRRPGEVSALARSANDPQVIELIRRYQDNSHPSRRFGLPKPKEPA